ncbi:hypothetical protein CYMTET_55228 [Cymbomonas tetramitiformis]|uniref:Uncharacterized protein n=1 Tax=Cymbomonas tetramitiformis TaxID=36881 RepID=A0AAE0BEU6_9CHLO|nr:hypothetical protein CYMTET_55228 [Cymbomonas tetramitiformis]|eukprot:gene71-103_t
MGFCLDTTDTNCAETHVTVHNKSSCEKASVEVPVWIRMLAHAKSLHVKNASRIKQVVLTTMNVKDCPDSVSLHMRRLIQPPGEPGGVYKANNGGKLAASLKAIIERTMKEFKTQDDENCLIPLEESHPEFKSYLPKKYKKKQIKQLSGKQSSEMSWDQWLAVALPHRSNVSAHILRDMKNALTVCENLSICEEIQNVIKNRTVTASNGSALKVGIRSILSRHAPHALPVQSKAVRKTKPGKVECSDTEEECSDENIEDTDSDS